MNERKEVLYVDLEDILPNRFQPRLNFDEKGINELALSIKQHGIIQPLIVRRLGNKYEIIAGERRYKASTVIGLKKVPVIVTDVDDNKSAEMAVVENIQRKDMSPLEEAKSFEKILKSENITQEDLAIRMGKSQALIANKLRLLSLSEEVQDALLNEKISERHARSLLRVKNLELQKEILNEIIEKKLNVKSTEDLILKKTDDQEIKPFDLNFKQEPTIESNPQLDILYNLNKEKEETINVELPIVEKVNENLESINIEKPKANLDELLEGREPEIKEEVKENKFINENMFSTDIFDIKDLEKPEVLENINEDKKEVLKDIEEIKNLIGKIKNNGTKISFDEMDFESLYKIIINIEK